MTVHGLDERDDPVRARIPADLDSADQLIAGLSPGQVLTCVALGSPVLLVWRALAGQVPAPVLLGASIPVLAGVLALVLARRDGLSLDRWLVAALRYRLSARQMSVAEDLTPRLETEVSGRFLVGPLAGITDDGVLVHADGRHAALVACTTITTALSTHQDDAILAAGMARWLNSLSGPVQIVVRNRPADLAGMATALTRRALEITNPALAALALEHAETLLDTYEAHRPLQRTVLIACGGGVRSGPEQARQNLARLRQKITHRDRRSSASDVMVSARARAEALSRAARTVGELEALGVRAEILDGAQVQHVLTSTWSACHLPASPAENNDTEPDLDGLTEAWGFTDETDWQARWAAEDENQPSTDRGTEA
ncbi:PrgI family protein [Kineosporia babensis]|uniref:PrgI family protein n=1 Tax=Kineosporia babensis TaxID=499548 RepID=A0A9X1NMN4_9ACTN|nr:PrgI family protein [Kineosporia babensis]